MKPCRACNSLNISEVLDLGLQPVSNRLLSSPDEKEELFPIRLGLCRDCGLTQLLDLIPAEELKPRFDWVTYNEPEGHLDAMVERLIALSGIGRDAAVLGISFKDDSTLRRLKNKGFSRVQRLDPVLHFGITDRNIGAETIQSCIYSEGMLQAAKKTGKADLVIVRHLLEHASDLRRFLDGLKELLRPEGYLVVEAPDSSRALEQFDYTAIWEEHTVYFSPATLRRSMEESGFSIEGFDVYPYPFEDSLVCIARAGRKNKIVKEDARLGLDIAQRFARGFPVYGKKARAILAKYRREKGKIAMFGAGHLACVFLNFFGLRDFVECVIDDNQYKKGLYMPGSRLPIMGRDVLISREIGLCLLALNPINEEKVLAASRDFISKGGEFRSIFPGSPIAVNLEEVLA